MTVKFVTAPESSVVEGQLTMLLAPRVPPLLALTNVAAAGSVSLAMTLLAVEGPKLVTLIV